MFEDRLRDILVSTNTGKVLVFSTINARQTLYAKGLSPAIFLHKYYTHPNGEPRVSYNIKEKTSKEMCQLCPIDLEQYECYREDRMNKIIREKILSKSKLPKQLTKNDLVSKQLIENYLKNLNFFWFEEAIKIFLYCLTLDETNFRVGTLEQPLGLVFFIEIGPGINVKTQYEKIRVEAEIKLKKMFALNASRTKNISILVILIYDAEKQGSIADMRTMQDILRQQYSLQNGLLCLVEINGATAKDTVDWSSYPGVVIKNQYKLQPSDPIRLLGQNEDIQLKQFVDNHRQKIRQNIQDRLRWLGARYEDNNTAKNKFFNFFKGQENERSYTADEIDSREIADYLFLLGDYKRALDLYKDLTSKFQGAQGRQAAILHSLSEMVQLSKFMCAMTGGSRMKAYESIKKFAQKYMFKRAYSIGKTKMHRYLVYILYFLHGFKIFDRDFIKNSFYQYLKQSVNQQVYSEINPHPSLIPSLILQQYANLNLLLPFSQYRRYGYDVVRVASKFSEFRLFDHHLRCLLIGHYIYDGTFPALQKYINSSLSRTYLQLKKYRFSIERIQQTWKSLLTVYQDNSLQNEEDNQFTKLYTNQFRLLTEIQKAEPEELARQTQDCIPVPKILDVMVEVWDEGILNCEGLGSKWQEVGDIFLGEPELTSKGMSKQNLMKILKLFDATTPQEKQLAYRIRNLPKGQISQAMLKRNTRQAFVGEPIIVSFDMKNFLPLIIEITNIKLHLKVHKKCSFILQSPKSGKLILKHGQKANISFEVIPEEEGLYQFSHISWTFFKMTSIYKFKEPWEAKSVMKSLYYKVNVMQECGQLKATVKHGHKFYEGQSDELEIVLQNKGKQPIQQIYLAVDSSSIFGFKMKRLDITIDPNQTTSTVFKIKMPVLKSLQFMKVINKAIFLYKTSSSFRVHRTVTTFNVHRVAEISNINCERISTTLHFLSFSVKHPSVQNQKLELLKSMIVRSGLDIKKVEVNHLETLSHYFFFMKKNPQTQIEQYKFTYHDFPSQDIIKQTYLTQVQPQADEEGESQKHAQIQLYFLWWDKDNHCGVVDPKPIKITTTESLPTVFKLPFNAKVLLEDEIECNFSQQIFAQVEVSFIIKNIFSVKDINLTVQFTQGQAQTQARGQPNDFYWEGITSHSLCLKFNEERKMNLKMIVLRPGLFNVAKNIKYTIFINKANGYKLKHSDHQNIYLLVNGDKKVESFDFFDQVPLTAFKKQQEQSLI